MATQRHKMTTAVRLSRVWDLGDLIFDTDLGSFWLGDLITPGGLPIGGSGNGSNLANTDLTLSESRTHSTNGNDMTFQGDGTEDFSFTGALTFSASATTTTVVGQNTGIAFSGTKTDLTFAAGADLRINDSPGVAGDFFRGAGASDNPYWGKITTEDLENTGALYVEDTDWDSGTTYVPNTLLKHSGKWYLHEGVADSLNEDPSSGAPWELFSDPTLVGGGTSNPWERAWVDNHFIGPDMADDATLRDFGPWQFNIVGGGTFNSRASTDAAAAHPGIMSIKADSSGTASSGGTLRMLRTALRLGVGSTFRAIVRIPTGMVASIQSYAGFGVSTSGNNSRPDDGAYFHFNGTNFVGRCSSSDTDSDTASSFAPTANVWYHLEVRKTAAAEVTFTIYTDDGATAWTDTVTTNIPAESVGLHAPLNASALGAVAASADLLEVDYIGTGYLG